MPTTFQLQFDPNQIIYWASRYSYLNEDHIIRNIQPRIHQVGYLSKSDFLELCEWKTPRTRKRCAQNTADFIEAVTHTALSTTNEQLRIEVLTLLSGVRWPTASVILHFGHQDRYPILDFRALQSLGVNADPNTYDFDLWWDYTQFCRHTSQAAGVSMRMLDRALWQYSKEN